MPKNKSGIALVMVMVTILILEIIGFLLVQGVCTKTSMAFNRVEKLQAEYLAEAGLAHGLWRLQEDPNYRVTMENQPMGNGFYNVSFSESSGKIMISSQARVNGAESVSQKSVSRLVIQPGVSGIFVGEDTYIDQDHPNDFFETKEPKRLVLRGETGKNVRTLVRFDLTKYPIRPEAIVIASRFSMYLYNSPQVTQNYRLRRLTKGWVPGQTNWYKRTSTSFWTLPGGDFDTTGYEDIKAISGIENGWKTWRATNLTRFWLANPGQNYGLILETDQSIQNKQFHFYSSAYTSYPAFIPKLTIYYLDSRSS